MARCCIALEARSESRRWMTLTEVAKRVVIEIAEEQGRQRAARKGRNDLPAFAEDMQAFSGGGALKIEMVESNAERVGFNVRRCRFAEMYRQMGAGDIGGLLSCNRDFSNVTGFNPQISLSRTQTIMQGADYCNFRYPAPAGEGARPSGERE